ncbi:MAG: hypothetical protein EBZ95_08305 [Chitinophagia bacterium]|nr:hypothetical protein [Chitinophagia bacterium]
MKPVFKINRKLLLLIFCIGLLTFTADCQEPTIIKRLQAISVNDNLFIRNNETTSFQYKIDRDSIWRDIKSGQVFTVKKNHNHSVGVYIKFYSPLKYNVNSSFKDVDDPIYLSFTQFINTVLPLLKDFSSMESRVLPLVPLQTNLSSFNLSLLLYQWTFDFINQVDFAAIKADSSMAKQKLYNSLVKEINEAAKPIDDYLFRSDIMIANGLDSSKTNGFTKWLEIRKESLLSCPSDYTLFVKELTLSKNVEEELTNIQKLSEKGVAKIQQLLTSNFNARIFPLLKDAGAENFKQYSSAASILIFMNAAARMDSQSEALKKFTALLKTLNNFVNDFESDVKGYRKEGQVDLEETPTKMVNLTYGVNSIDKEGNTRANKNLQIDCIIARQHTIVPFVSTGIFYTDLVYPAYALQQGDGEWLVAQTKEKSTKVRPAVFLNLLFSTKSNWLYPFFQLGLTTGANDFLIPVGAGIVIAKKLSISGGAVFGMGKRLTNLRINGPVKDEATLKNDLSNRVFSAAYFSLNYNFFK